MFKNKSQSIAIIPARLKSTRFPEKVLAKAKSRTLLEHTFENTQKAALFDKIIIATDDEKVQKHAQTFCKDVFLTCNKCKSGTERIVDLLKKVPDIVDDQIIFNIQADHPTTSEKTLKDIENILLQDPLAQVATAVCPITTEKKFLSPHIVKCIFDRYQNAIYFSRSPIPYIRDWEMGHSCFQHIGIYAFRRKFLDTFGKFKKTPLCETEDLEQLKILEYGYKIKVAVVEENPIGIDTPEDFKDFLKIL